MSLKFMIPLLAVAFLAGCETTREAGSTQQGYSQGSGGYGASVHSRKYINKAYGNCGHCMGNTGR